MINLEKSATMTWFIITLIFFISYGTFNSIVEGLLLAMCITIFVDLFVYFFPANKLDTETRYSKYLNKPYTRRSSIPNYIKRI